MSPELTDREKLEVRLLEKLISARESGDKDAVAKLTERYKVIFGGGDKTNLAAGISDLTPDMTAEQRSFEAGKQVMNQMGPIQAAMTAAGAPLNRMGVGAQQLANRVSGGLIGDSNQLALQAYENDIYSSAMGKSRHGEGLLSPVNVGTTAGYGAPLALTSMATGGAVLPQAITSGLMSLAESGGRPVREMAADTALGTVLGAVGGGASNAGGRVLGGRSSRLQPGLLNAIQHHSFARRGKTEAAPHMLDAAKRVSDLGFKLTPATRMQDKTLLAGEAARYSSAAKNKPLIAAEEHNQRLINNITIKAAGGDKGDYLTRDVFKKLKKDNGKLFDEATAGVSIGPLKSASLSKRLDNIVNKAGVNVGTRTDDIAAISDHINQIKEQILKRNGIISGEDLKRWKHEIGDAEWGMHEAKNASVASNLKEVRVLLDDTLKNAVQAKSPKQLEKLLTARERDEILRAIKHTHQRSGALGKGDVNTNALAPYFERFMPKYFEGVAQNANTPAGNLFLVTDFNRSSRVGNAIGSSGTSERLGDALDELASGAKAGVAATMSGASPEAAASFAAGRSILNPLIGDMSSRLYMSKAAQRGIPGLSPNVAKGLLNLPITGGLLGMPQRKREEDTFKSRIVPVR